MSANHQQSPIVEQIVMNSGGSSANWPKLLTVDSVNVANPSFKWRIGSRFVVPTVGLFSKFWMNVANNSTVHNAAILYEALNQNYLASRSTRTWFGANRSLERRPLITYSNHQSCLDDPLMWGALIPLRWQFNSDRHRWSSAAAEVCFSKRWHSMFFSLGKTFPIIRGEGIYQPAMDYATKLMKAGQWLHFFPEGKVIPKPENCDPDLLLFRFDENGRPVDLKKLQAIEDDSAVSNQNNSSKELSFADSFFKSKLSNSTTSLVTNYSLKWGIARLIIEHVLGEGSENDSEYDKFYAPKQLNDQDDIDTTMELQSQFDDQCCQTLPEVDVLPIYHVGMDDVLPTRKPYVPQMFQKITFLVRPEGPIRIDRAFLQRLFGEEVGTEFKSNTQKLKNQTQPITLSLTEKRIRLMQFLEDELNNLRDKALWLHDHFHTINKTDSTDQ
ncbi:hypothetical protein BLOT_014216 [Blomia tropicalis]|nr:hypothetical protein BLOT_014216 [Blomia tropicalis]